MDDNPETDFWAQDVRMIFGSLAFWLVIEIFVLYILFRTTAVEKLLSWLQK